MIMGVGQPVAANPLALFYVWNLVAALSVAIFGGVWVVRRSERESFRWFDANAPSARRILVIGLGVLWIVDGLLQAQPLLVKRFAEVVLSPLVAGQPAPVANLVRLGTHVWNIDPVVSDSIAVWIQIGIGIGIVFGHEAHGRRLALWASVGWGIVVWGVGEAFGSLFAGGSWLVGSPGSALFYVLTAGVLLLPAAWWTSVRFARIWERIMAAVLALAAGLQAWPDNRWWAPNAMRLFFLAQARMAQPSVVSRPIYGLAHVVGLAGAEANAVLSGLLALLALLWAVGSLPRVTWGLTFAVTAMSWWLAQDLGVFGGMSTDPNSGLILLLILIAFRTLSMPQPVRAAGG